ncbi:sensor histidine kinase [Dyadobacter sp. 32]|uniref:tetratricopeptide repeat-containing sensor histidine kinase n=1 Tax=Dyadobacter sp. 32 TaxID=538966 RepID=UPI0011EC9C22
MKAGLFIFLLVHASVLFGQTKRIDALRNHIYKTSDDPERLAAILALCEEYHSLNRDTLDYYAYHARALAVKIKAGRRERSLAELAVAHDYYRWGWIDSLLLVVNTELPKNPVTDPKARDIYFKLTLLKAKGYGGRSRYQESLSVFYEAIRMAEKYRDTLNLGIGTNSVGSLALMREQPKEAIKWVKKALSYTNDNDRKYAYIRAAGFINLAGAFNLLGQNDSARYYVDRGVALSKEIENLNFLATGLRIRSQIYTDTGKLKEAEATLVEMWETRKKSGDENQYTDDGLMRVNFYIQTRQYNKAIAYCKKALLTNEEADALKINSRVSAINLRKDYYQLLAKCYKAVGKNALYQETLEKLVAAKDSFYKDNSADAMAEMQVKYESEKQQSQIKDLENEKLQQVVDKQAMIRNFLLGLAALGIALTGYVIFTNRRLREHNKVLIRKNREIEEAHFKGQHVERKRVASELHDNLNTKLAALRWRLEALNLAGYPEKDQKALTGLIGMLEDVYDDVRLISHNMLPAELESQGLTAAVQKLIEKLNVNPKTVFSVVLDEMHERLDQKVEFELYNITLELVNNIIKHARASQVWISISQDGAKTTLTVSDNGVGFEAGNESQGIGLRNIGSRVEALKGIWKVESSPGQGAKVIVEVLKR